MAIDKGSIVWLKTGGPSMTVKYNVSPYVAVGEEWVCSWFDNGKINEHNFSVEQLTETDPNLNVK